jgi:hypothetical protein
MRKQIKISSTHIGMLVKKIKEADEGRGREVVKLWWKRVMEVKMDQVMVRQWLPDDGNVFWLISK